MSDFDDRPLGDRSESGGGERRGPEFDAEKLKRDAEKVREEFESRWDDVRTGVNDLFPPEFKQHMRNARREFWLAVRGVIDSRLDSIERESTEPKSSPRRGKIDID